MSKGCRRIINKHCQFYYWASGVVPGLVLRLECSPPPLVPSLYSCCSQEAGDGVAYSVKTKGNIQLLVSLFFFEKIYITKK